MTTLGRARVIKGPVAASAPPRSAEPALARRVPREAVDAREEAARILAEARAKAERLVAEARAAAADAAAQAAREAREAAEARVIAEHLALRALEERRAERELDRTVEIASLLAERMLGEAVAIAPERVAALAATALEQTRGARRVRVEACAEDVPALREALAALGEGVAEVVASDELERGSLVVHTELGRIDARLGPQLARLAGALREALRERARGTDIGGE